MLVASKHGQCLLSGKTKVATMLQTPLHHSRSPQTLVDRLCTLPIRPPHQVPAAATAKQVNQTLQIQTMSGCNPGLLVCLA